MLAGILLLMTYNITLWTQHKLVVLVSVPRALSTVLLRSIKQRKDFIVLNEPGIKLYQAKFHREQAGLDTLEIDASFVTVRAKIGSLLMKHNVFVKEMFCAAEEYIFDGESIINSDDIIAAV